MPRRHNTILHDRVALAAGATPLEKDLPINPINFISVALRLLNNGANAVPKITDLLATIQNIDIQLDGRSLAQGSLTDLAVLTYAMWGVAPLVQPISKVDNNIVNCVVHIPFSRKPWWAEEALPVTRKGDLVMKITPAATFTGLDTLTLTVEVRQILDATPERFLKYVTGNKTPADTNPHSIDLLTGPDYVGVLFFGTTVPTAASQNASIAKLKLRVDEVEQMIPETRWESLHSEWTTWRTYPMLALDHTHIENLGAAYTQFADSGRPEWDDHLLNNYAYVDFDPSKDLNYRLITRGRARVDFVITPDVADALRFLPVEIVPLGTPAGPTA